jgi:hypothetical protein
MKLELYVAGLPIERAGQIAVAVKQLARDSLRRGVLDRIAGGGSVTSAERIAAPRG